MGANASGKGASLLLKLTDDEHVMEFAAWSPDDKFILSGGDGGIKLWDTMVGLPFFLQLLLSTRP